MAFNGSGTFSRLYNWATDKANAIKIRADRMDAEMDGIATGLSNVICRDGQSTISANIPFNNKKITGLADATAATDALNRQAADARFMRYPNALTAETGIDVADYLAFYDTSASANKGITYANFKADLVTEGIAGTASVFGRSGAVVAVSGDYTASQVTNVAAGNIVATTVQTAINELDTEKLALAGGTMTGTLTTTAAGLVVGASTPFSDSAGTLTLQNVDALDATTEATIEAAIDTLANLTSVQSRTVTLGGNLVTASSFTTSGANALTLTTTGATNVTLPTTGTLVAQAAIDTDIDQLKYGLSASVAANALTISLKTLAGNDASAGEPVKFYFRNATLTSGAPQERSVTAALSLTISSGSTMGASNGIPFRLWLVLMDNAGVMRLGLINCYNSSTQAIKPLSAAGVASATAEGGAGAADSAGTIYATAAVTSKAYLVLGYLEWTSGLTTAGTWNAAPDIVQIYQPGVRMPGEVVQRAFKSEATYSAIATTMPNDDTIPQNTEGGQITTLDITPTSPCNLLRIAATAPVYNTTSGAEVTMTMALFQDSTASALSAIYAFGSQTPGAVLYDVYYMLAGTTSATTMKWRIGSSSATTYVNGSGTARILGGVSAFTGEIEEVQT